MLKKITATVLILIGLIMLSNVLFEEFNPNNKWLKNTYSLKIYTLKTRIHIPKRFKDLNLDTYYELIPKQEDTEMRARLIQLKIKSPDQIILVDSTNSSNQIHIYKHSVFTPINEENRKLLSQAFATKEQDLPYALQSTLLDSSIGAKDNLQFIRLKMKLSSSISDKFLFVNIYLVTVNDYSFILHIQTQYDEDASFYIKNLVVRQQYINIIG